MEKQKPSVRADEQSANPVTEPCESSYKDCFRILVVDDEEGILKFVKDVLSRAGYSVLIAHSGIDALIQSRGQEKTIALLLTDVVMPDLNGPHLAELLLRSAPGMRILFMSGWEPHVITHESVLWRNSRRIEKPFTPEQLVGAVEAALSERYLLPTDNLSSDARVQRLEKPQAAPVNPTRS
jgi:DNA-binding NtrC family response regulator